MPRPYQATPRVAHNPEAMPRPYPATHRVAHNSQAMPRPWSFVEALTMRSRHGSLRGRNSRLPQDRRCDLADGPSSIRLK